MTTAYASLCDSCGHLMSRHSLVAGAASLRLGPYRCRDCKCKISQDSPSTGLSKAQYERWAEENPRLTWDHERAAAPHREEQ